MRIFHGAAMFFSIEDTGYKVFCTFEFGVEGCKFGMLWLGV
jgi:hypothetical protein